ncbi:MAG: hypothetical protein JWQ27_172 [Ferruginibacter sp.]|nr:hypothetical protein [Ferruginibacter sp.]
MRIKNIYAAVRWQLTKALRFFLHFDERFWKPKKTIDLNQLFSQRASQPGFFFIQVGANDGLTGDSLREYIIRYKWQGVLVEPVPYVFARLVENYQAVEGLNFENSAIGSSDGLLNFYSLAEFDLQGNKLFSDTEKYKIDQLGSFDKETLLKHAYMHQDFEKLIREIKVPTIPFSQLCAKYQVQKIGLLQLDVEGYDYEILKDINFATLQPSIVIFEHQHMKKLHYKAIVKKLSVSGYDFFVDNWDTVAILQTK